MTWLRQSQKRLPFLVWGDLRCGDGPVLRRKLVGWRAHECMYAWVYLTDYLAVRKIEDIWTQTCRDRIDAAFFPSLNGALWNHHDRSVIDPHFQINGNSFETAAFGVAILSATDWRPLSVSELGSTFSTAIDKFRLAGNELARLDAAVQPIQPAWYGIDNSRFVTDVARTLHSAGVSLEIVDDYRKVQKPDGYSMLISRFVCSYVFKRTEELAEFLLANYDSGIVEDAFAAVGGEIEVYNHGQRETFLDIVALCRKLQGAARRVFLLDVYPDFPAGTVACFVCKLVFMDRQTDIGVLSRRIRLLGYEFDADAQEVDTETLLERLNSATSDARWTEVQRYKRREPVWGKTPISAEPVPPFSRLMNCLYRLRRAIAMRRDGWRRLNLHNAITVGDVEDALGDNRNA